MQALVLRRYAKVFTLVMGLFLAVSGTAMAQSNNANSPMGWWLDQTGKAGIFISQCSEGLCGQIRWLRDPVNANGTPKLDIHNKDVSLRDRKVCGLWMLGQFVPDGPDSWKNGWIYDPASGKTYKSVMQLASDGTLHVRGYVGIPLFGRSEIWTRSAKPLTPCTGG